MPRDPFSSLKNTTKTLPVPARIEKPGQNSPCVLELKVSGKGVRRTRWYSWRPLVPHDATDVDSTRTPRLSASWRRREWTDADIMLVTDGEIAPPTRTFSRPQRRRDALSGTQSSRIARRRTGRGRRISPPLCTHTHTFEKLEQGERSQTLVTRRSEREHVVSVLRVGVVLGLDVVYREAEPLRVQRSRTRPSAAHEARHSLRTPIIAS